MGIFANLLSKKMNRQVETYQQELVQTHYQEVENMYRQMRGWRHDWRRASSGIWTSWTPAFRRWTWSSRPETR